MNSDSLEKLKDIIKALRDPNTGCPWDRVQTHESLRRFVIEEAYEVVEAIEDAPEKLSEELGDLLLQILLHAQIASEEDRFTFETVAAGLAEKLIRRHPHVFGGAKAESVEEVKQTWERVKAEERGESLNVSALDTVSKHLPALLEASTIGKKVAPKNFDWESPQAVFAKVEEELAEVAAELEKHPVNHSLLEEEIGDLLFTVAQLARKLDLDPEITLKRANRKFSARFKTLEQRCAAELHEADLSKIPRESLEKLWGKIKLEQEK